eukprot:SM002062S06356  [mRNA]  locus=s2062:432:665:+ [translate_table: standard]
MFGIFLEVGYEATVVTNPFMPIQSRADGLHTRPNDPVATTLSGGPRILAVVVTTNLFDRLYAMSSASKEGQALNKWE